MLKVKNSTYQPPILLKNGHLGTIYPALFRRVKEVEYIRERLETPDDDFIDIDWIRKGNQKIVLISHGLEGNSERPYVTGMAKIFNEFDFDVAAWNYRSCSGEMNKQKIMYHSGATGDLSLVIDHLATLEYEEIFLIGFSLGGNMTLKYLGEQRVNPKIKKSVVFSVPLDLFSGAQNISKPHNALYEKRFIRSLKKKIQSKELHYPDEYNSSKFDKIKTLMDFDDAYTAPIHGFKDAKDYYDQCSSKYFVDKIEKPTLVINAKNDPLLPEACLDEDLFHGNEFATLELPDFGGHCGFTSFKNKPFYWSEQRALAFCITD